MARCFKGQNDYGDQGFFIERGEHKLFAGKEVFDAMAYGMEYKWLTPKSMDMIHQLIGMPIGQKYDYQDDDVYQEFFKSNYMNSVMINYSNKTDVIKAILLEDSSWA